METFVLCGLAAMLCVAFGFAWVWRGDAKEAERKYGDLLDELTQSHLADQMAASEWEKVNAARIKANDNYMAAQACMLDVAVERDAIQLKHDDLLAKLEAQAAKQVKPKPMRTFRQAKDKTEADYARMGVRS